LSIYALTYGVFTRSSKLSANVFKTRANAGRLLDRVNTLLIQGGPKKTAQS